MKAAAASSGCSAQTVYGGHEHAARQTVLALTAGRREGRSSDLLIVPGTRHALEEVEDSVILLTVSK